MTTIYLEILLFLFFAYYFYSREKPKIRFFFLGVLFVIISLLLQLPIRLAEPYIRDYLMSDILPTLVIAVGIPVLTELVKYFSLKRYLKTKSYKNGIFFGIGWVGVQSIPYFALVLYSFIFAYFNIMYEPSSLIETSLPLWSFIFFFVVNLAITVLVIFSVIKNTKIYLFYAIIYSILVYYSLFERSSDIILQIIFFIFSLFLIFKYRMIG